MVGSSKVDTKVAYNSVKLLKEFCVPKDKYDYRYILILSTNSIRLGNYLKQVIVDHLDSLE